MESQAEMPCPRCGVLSPFKLRPETPHYGEIRCAEHGHNWIPKPSDEKRTRRKTSLKLMAAISEERRDWCWRCLRNKEVLCSLNPPLLLEVHHVIEVSDGGTDSADNLQVLCAECHEETHRDRRRYARYA